MDWLYNLLLLLGLMPFVYTWSPIPSTSNNNNVPSNNFIHSRSFSNTQQQAQQHYYQRNAVSPYIDLMFCPLREQPWSCARQQSARLLDIWDGELNVQWQKLKAEADRQLNSTLQRRGYSDSTTLSKEKPSTILKKIEIGTKYMKDYLAETMDGFLGREYEYLQNTKNHYQTQNDADNEEEYDEEEEEEAVQNDNDNNEQTGDVKNSNNADEHSNSNNVGTLNNSEPEFIEIEEEEHEEEENNEENEENNEENTDDGDADAIEEGKKPGGDKRKKKKKKGSSHDVANLLVIKPIEHQLASHHDDSFGLHGATQLLKPVIHKIKPSKQKKKKKKGGHGGGHGGHGGHGGGAAEIYVEQEPATDHFGLGLLEELAEWDDDTGGKRKKKHPMKYGRSNGVTRGKKKKKKKAIMKLMLLASFIKAKIELLLKLLGAHLQIKFFAIALIGLLINIARFWIDVKRGGTPQKVVYVEHAHHQHHYEDHGDDWSESAGGGGYWKRSLQTDSTENTYDSATDSYQPKTQQYQPSGQQYDAQYMAYRNQWQRK